ncbi:MAG TPA: hypothetical protein VG871_02860, partial [Vicinamibacterales bacterium]|nr:hypothetical protein [Vicinamibacterales bacterium]
MNLDSHYACFGQVGVSLGRRGVRRFQSFTVPAAAPAAASGGQLRGDRGPVGLHGVELRAHRGLVRPLVRIETLHTRRQPVSLFGRPATPADTLEQVQIGRAELGSPLRSGDAP